VIQFVLLRQGHLRDCDRNRHVRYEDIWIYLSRYIDSLRFGWGFPAHAEPRWCDGKIDRVLVYGDGGLMVIPAFRGEWLLLCNINVTVGGTPAEVCKGWHADVLAAMLADRQPTIFYAGLPPCATLPVYDAAPNPVYVTVIR
jgi:hypothetical protein